MADTDAHTTYLIYNKYPSETDTAAHSDFQKRKLRHNLNTHINSKSHMVPSGKPMPQSYI